MTWGFLVMLVTTIASGVGGVLTTLGITNLIVNLNTFLLGIPIMDVIGGFFNQNLLTGYGAIIAILLIGYILYRLIRRRTRKKKRVKK